MLEKQVFCLNVAAILRRKASESGIAKARILEDKSGLGSSLNLRNLDLNSSDFISLAECLKQEKRVELQSISLSYNPLMGDSGAIALVGDFPATICELGMVNCGIGDRGGVEILKWMKSSENLKMVCIEGNDYSDNLRKEFEKFSVDNRQIIFVF